MEKVGIVALTLIERFGLQALTFSRLARSSGVSRPWLYQYIGNTKESLVQFAVRMYGLKIAELESYAASQPQTPQEWVEDRLEGISNLLDDAVRMPVVFQLYWRYRDSDSFLGKQIKELEGSYLKHSATKAAHALRLRKKNAQFIVRMLMIVDMALALEWIQESDRTTRKKKAIMHLAKHTLNRTILRSRVL